jgi:hypothetical protein
VTTWVDVATAVGTIGSAGAAVYFGALQPRWHRPKLTLDDGGDARLNDPDGSKTWVRVTVSNHRDRDAAEDVQAVLVSVKTGQFDTDLKEVALAGYSLMWTAVNEGEETVLLPPGVSRILNIGYSTTLPEAGPLKFVLDLCKPGGGRQEWTDQIAVVELVVAARNARPVNVRYRLSLEGGVLQIPVRQQQSGCRLRLRWPVERRPQLPK